MRKRRTFDRQFKQQAVELSCSPNLTQKQVCKELGIAPNLLSRWRRELRDQSTESAESNDVAVLRQELADAKQALDAKDREIEFLKKAAGYFAQTTVRST